MTGTDALTGDSSSVEYMVNEWRNLATGANGRGGLEYGPLLEQMRLVQDRFVGAAFSADAATEFTKKLADLADQLAEFQVPESQRIDGFRPDLPGRGSALLVPFITDEQTPTSIKGRVTFTRFHVGSNSVVHGGIPPLLFDDVLGFVANREGVFTRTASLKVDFRRLTPIDVELYWEASLDHVAGRKYYTSARITNAGGEVLSEATGLFIAMLAHQG